MDYYGIRFDLDYFSSPNKSYFVSRNLEDFSKVALRSLDNGEGLERAEVYIDQNRKIKYTQFYKIIFDGSYYSYYIQIPSIGWAENSLYYIKGNRKHTITRQFGVKTLQPLLVDKSGKYLVFSRQISLSGRKLNFFILDLESVKTSLILSGNDQILNFQ